MTQSFPLVWPQHWPRTPFHKQTSNGRLATVSFAAARESIFAELRRLGATSIVLSTNVPLRMDGMPSADAARRRMPDSGVAVYFQLRNKPMTMARDAYYDVAQNLRSLALAIEYLRGLERHGGATMLERAFTGFTALPPPSGGGANVAFEEEIDWREELDMEDIDLPNADMLVVAESRYRTKAKTAHADSGGSNEKMIRLNLAIEEARKELK